MIVSSLFLLASICMLILSTIPEFQVRLVMVSLAAGHFPDNLLVSGGA